MNAAQPDTTIEPSTRVPPEATQVLIGRDLNARTHSVLAQWPSHSRVSSTLTDLALLALETDRVVERTDLLLADERPVTVIASPLPIGDPPRACATAIILDWFDAHPRR